MCAATSSSLPPIGPTPRARAPSLSPAPFLLSRVRPAIIPPHYSALFRSHPRARPEAHDARRTHLRGYMGARMEITSLRERWILKGFFFYFPSRNICALDLMLWIFLSLPSHFFLILHSVRILIAHVRDHLKDVEHIFWFYCEFEKRNKISIQYIRLL